MNFLVNFCAQISHCTLPLLVNFVGRNFFTFSASTRSADDVDKDIQASGHVATTLSASHLLGQLMHTCDTV